MTDSRPTELAEVIGEARCLLLDFDGPICAVFAGTSARQIAVEMMDGLRVDGFALPFALQQTKDPFDVLRYAATIGAKASERTEARLRAAEIAAVRRATSTAGAERLVASWRRAGRRVAAVSNNSQTALSAYLSQHSISMDAAIGRTSADPALLKPRPDLVWRALEYLHAAPSSTVFVGDSPSDIVAGRAVGLTPIGFANKPGKREKLLDAGARHVVETLDPLVLPQSRTEPSESHDSLQ